MPRYHAHVICIPPNRSDEKYSLNDGSSDPYQFESRLSNNNIAHLYYQSDCREIIISNVNRVVPVMYQYCRYRYSEIPCEFYLDGSVRFDDNLGKLLKTLLGNNTGIKPTTLDDIYGLCIYPEYYSPIFLSMLMLIYSDQIQDKNIISIARSILTSDAPRWKDNYLQQLFTAFYLFHTRLISFPTYMDMTPFIGGNGPGSYIYNNSKFFANQVFDAFVYYYKDEVIQLLKEMFDQFDSDPGMLQYRELKIIEYIRNIKTDANNPFIQYMTKMETE